MTKYCLKSYNKISICEKNSIKKDEYVDKSNETYFY